MLFRQSRIGCLRDGADSGMLRIVRLEVYRVKRPPQVLSCLPRDLARQNRYPARGDPIRILGWKMYLIQIVDGELLVQGLYRAIVGGFR